MHRCALRCSVVCAPYSRLEWKTMCGDINWICSTSLFNNALPHGCFFLFVCYLFSYACGHTYKHIPTLIQICVHNLGMEFSWSVPVQINIHTLHPSWCTIALHICSLLIGALISFVLFKMNFNQFHGDILYISLWMQQNHCFVALGKLPLCQIRIDGYLESIWFHMFLPDIPIGFVQRKSATENRTTGKWFSACVYEHIEKQILFIYCILFCRFFFLLLCSKSDTWRTYTVHTLCIWKLSV